MSESAATVVVTTTLSRACTVNGTSLLSTACTVKTEVPMAVGVPAMTPVAALNVRPAGMVPETKLHVSAPVPPLAVRVVLYATPTTPGGGTPAITGSGLTVMLTTFLLCVPAMEAVRVTSICEVRPAGAVYVVPRPSTDESVPQPAPLQVAPESTQPTVATPCS